MMSNIEDAWVWKLTIGEVLRKTAQRFPKSDAVVCPLLQDHETSRAVDSPAFQISYAEFDQQVDQAARSLLALGVKKGVHVGIWATNQPRWAIIQFAAARIGAVLVTINPAYRKDEVAYVLKQADITTLFVVEEFRTSNYIDILQELIPEFPAAKNHEFQTKDFPRLSRVVCLHETTATGVFPWQDFVALEKTIPADEVATAEAKLSPTDAINIQYTSGTTGFPKGATLTHRNLLLNALFVGERMTLTDADRICMPVPFYHCFGCVYGTLIASVYGAALVIPNEYFDAVSTVNAIKQQQCSIVYGVPTMFIAMMETDEYEPASMTSLRSGIVAGSPCPIDLMKRIVSEMGASEITIVYGLTENSPGITQTCAEDELKLRVETVGPPLPGINVRIVNPETGQILDDNEQGELCTSGHGVMLGYYNMPEMTAAAIDAEGWLHTGDLAIRLPNGYYKITGRIKDMICRGGENIYPREIEEFLFTLPEIQDVAVVGIPDPKYVEEVAAWIILRADASLTADELRERCRKHIAHYKIPRHVRFVQEFPMTVTGKVQKFRMREVMINELGLNESETA